MAGGHETMLTRAEAGCLLIADVSGYTAYLGGTELEHAQDVLADLIETVVRRLDAAFRLAEVEGDAVFVYSIDDADGLDAAMLLDTVEQTYFAFRSRSRDIVQATACTCQACQRIPSLDLKFVVHHGRFVRQEVAGAAKPAGTDVVVTHRLLKNTVAERHGRSAYALLTDACVVALGLAPGGLGLVEHQEDYDDVGQVRCWIADLAERWRSEQERRQVFVPAEEAQFELTRQFAVAAPVLWEYQTSPHKRLLWQTEFTRIDQANPGGRRGPGTTNHCVHGRQTIIEEILDWRPYRYFTVKTTVPGIGPWVSTFEFVEQAGDRTELRMRAARLTGWRRLLWSVMRRAMFTNMRRSMDRLEALLQPGAEVSARR
jgi:hypothetical protein